MNFFRSVSSDDEDPPEEKPHSDSPKAEHSLSDSPPKQSDPNPNPSGWTSFGGLIKTIATRSESVIETYRRDLQEFGSGLKKEIEVAQGSLENVGHVIDEFGNSVLKGTAQIINQGKEAILAADNESDSSSSDSNTKSLSTQRSLNSKSYSRFDAQVRAIQGDINTYSEEPEDLEDYNKWKSGFGMEEKKEEIERLMEENGEMRSIYKRIVGASNRVDHETFWCRYFYRVFKLKQAEDMRVKLVKKAISREEEEELSWDVDDEDDDEEEEAVKRKVESKATLKKEEDAWRKEKDEIVEEKTVNVESRGDVSENKEQFEKEKEKNPVEELRVESHDSDKEGKGSADQPSGGNVVTEKVNLEKNEEVCKENSSLKSVEKVASEAKGDNGESSNGNGKDSDFSVVSSHLSMPDEEDLGWDEIEDLSSIDDKNVDGKKGTHGGSPSSNRADLRKRLSTAEEDEDLSWDIEDDDEPGKA